jgi:NTE family protein
MRSLVLFGACLMSALVTPGLASGQDDHPKIALVLGGGGARGGAHIGVLEVLEELRIPIDFVAGTSIGSVIGGLYASGMAPDEMSTQLNGLDWADLLTDDPPRQVQSFRRREEDWFSYLGLELGIGSQGLRGPSGLLSAQKLEFVLGTLTVPATTVREFDELPLPYRAIGTDLSTGEAVIIASGSLPMAMRASMAIPGFFSPVHLDDRSLVDGGLSMNLPVELALDFGADVIIAVDVSPQAPDVDGGTISALTVSVRSLSILMSRNARHSQSLLRDQDRIFDFSAMRVGLLEFDRMTEAQAMGRAMLESRAEELRHLSVSEDEYAEFLSRQRRPHPGIDTGIRIDRVGVLAGKRVPRRIVEDRVRTSPGSELDFDALAEDLYRVYEVGEFERVAFELDRSGSENTLQIEVDEKGWGPNYLKFGLRLDAVSDGGTHVSLLAQHHRTFLNDLGAEWRTRIGLGDRSFLDTELFQPLIPNAWLFVAPRGRVIMDRLRIFDTDGDWENYRERSGFGQLDLGTQLWNRAEIRGGVRIGYDWYDLPSDQDFETSGSTGEFVGAAVLDTLDDVAFPDHGYELRAETRLSRTDLGAESSFSRAAGRALVATRIGRISVTASAEAGTDFSTELPQFDRFRLGGLFRVSGLVEGEREGGALALGALVARVHAGSLPEVVGRGFYLGAGIETGNAWSTANAMRIDDLLLGGVIFTAVDTHLGPIYLAYGFAEGGANSFRLVIGPANPPIGRR